MSSSITAGSPIGATAEGPIAAVEAPALSRTPEMLHPALAGGASTVIEFRVGERAQAIATRAIDIGVCLLVAPFALFVGLLVAIAIRLDDGGPVFFSHTRTGFRGRRFTMFKFRTMRPDAEHLKASLVHLNQVSGPDFKIPDDPRTTRVGRVLRRSHVDELPQLINILRGDMSLVGPRPTFIDPLEFTTWQLERLDVRPGLTGLWQVRRTGVQTSFDERVRLDIAYVREASAAADVRIMAATVRHCIRMPGH